MLEWSSQFETGHALIDAQHRMLIGYINRLENYTQKTSLTPEETGLFLRIVEFLETYMLTHFKEEEECMQRHRCPAQHDNRRSHGKFLEFFREFRHRLNQEPGRPELARELHEACSSWVREHILNLDTQLRPCMKMGTAPFS